MDPCYFCRKRKHASSACPTVGDLPRKRKRGERTSTYTWRSFEAARTYAQGLGLPNKAAWIRWCATSGHRAHDVPARPHKVKQYKGKWVSWGDWLGTGAVARGVPKQFRSFPDARAFARSLHLSSLRAWHRWCKDGDRPEDMPSLPSSVYAGQGWAGWVDFLGNELAEGEECAICFDPLKRKANKKRHKGRKGIAKLRGCGHRFHRGCIDDHVEARGAAATCPFCRGPLD